MAKFKPLVSDETLQRVYGRMLQARVLDEGLASLKQIRGIKTGEGAEAMLASLLDDLRDTDLVIARKADPQAQLMRGRSADAILGELLSTDEVASRALYTSAAPSLATFDSTPEQMALFAAGASRAVQDEQAGKRGKQRVTMALLGPVTKLANIDAALRAVGHGNLPLIMVCRTPGKQRLEVSRRALHGVPHMPVDARDAVALLRVAQESLLRARTGLGGVLVECRFFPGDPLQLLAERLHQKGIFNESAQEKSLQQFSTAFEKTLRTSRASKRRS